MRFAQLSMLLARSKKFLTVFIFQPLKILAVALNAKYISGAKKTNLGVNDLVVLCLVRDGELYMKTFIEHYLALGAKHIVFLDNSSTDETVNIAKRYENVTILLSTLPFKSFKLAMRLFLINRFGKNRWSLYVDIDELFDYPLSESLPIRGFLAYLSSYSYTAVVAQMLDMFSELPLSEITSSKDDDLKEIYRYYDISDITRIDYYHRNELSGDIKTYLGGIRRKVFGTDYEIGLILTKHPLIFCDKRIWPLYPDEHGVRNARIADITCVLLHYKFLGDFYARSQRIAKEESYHRNSMEYKRYIRFLRDRPDLRIIQNTSQKLRSTNDLIDNGFIIVSDAYKKWVYEKDCVLPSTN